MNRDEERGLGFGVEGDLVFVEHAVEDHDLHLMQRGAAPSS